MMVPAYGSVDVVVLIRAAARRIGGPAAARGRPVGAHGAGYWGRRRRETTMATNKGRTSQADATATLRVGDRAPDFTLTSHTGEPWRLADARGGNVVLAFYPFAFTAT